MEKRNAARPVGASLLAMEVNDDAGSLTPRGALGFFASKLAPTVELSTFERNWSAGRTPSLASQLPQFDRVHLQEIGRLSGRLREQARSHRRAKDDRCTPTLFTTQQAER